MPNRIAVGILIGGLSRRMGRPKALIDFGGRSLIESTAALALELTPDVVLLGRPPFEVPASLATLEILPDRHPGAGPIAGLDALLAARSETDVLLLACDMPTLTQTILKRITDCAADADAIVPCTHATNPAEARRHPCCARYRFSSRPALLAAIEAGEFAMMKLLARLRVHDIELNSGEARQLENWNTPEDVIRQDARAKDC